MSESAEKVAGEPVRLAYEPAPPWVRPPGWVLGVVGAYLLMVAGLVAVPGFIVWNVGENDLWWWPLAILLAGLMVAWISLLWIPVRVARRQRVTRRSLWLPIIGSGFLAALLLGGLILAVGECAVGVFEERHLGWTAGAAAAAWAVWAVVFWVASRGKGVEGFAGGLHRWLLAGSALELLVAVPAHVFVRRRGECCAGVQTGIGICCGIAVAVVAFGPGVAVLYYRRVKQISGGR